MEDLCHVKVEWRFDLDSDARAFERLMDELECYAEVSNGRLYMGSASRFAMVDSFSIGDNDDTVEMEGDVEWGIAPVEMLHFVSFAKYMSTNHLIRMNVDYAEPGKKTRGRFVYYRLNDGFGRIVHWSLPKEFWPVDTHEKDDNGYTLYMSGGVRLLARSLEGALDVCLANRGKEETVYDHI